MATESQTSSNAEIELNNNQQYRAGQRLTISNRVVNTLSFYLRRTGTYSTGDIQFQILSLTGAFPGTVLDTVTVMACSAVSTGITLYTATMSGILINEEVRIVVAPTVMLNDSSIFVSYQNTDVKASEYFTYSIGSWTNATTQDCAYQYGYDAAATGTVTTQSVTAISGTTATGNGNVTSLGVPAATQHGGCWNTTGTPTTADSKTENGVPAATGAFTSAITGLTASTKYYFRPYITNSQGTAYGSEVIFWADKGTVYPSEPLARVTNLIHRYDDRQAINQLEISLGDITSVLTPPFMENAARATADKQKAQDSTPIVETAVDEATSKTIVALKNYWSRQIPPYSANVTALQPESKSLTAKQLGLTREELAKLANQPGIIELLRQLGKR